MLKCPFCGYGNEDGSLFCEQCKSDLSAVESAAPAAEQAPWVFTTPPADAIPLAPLVEPAVKAVGEAVQSAVHLPPTAEHVPLVGAAAEAPAGMPIGQLWNEPPTGATMPAHVVQAAVAAAIPAQPVSIPSAAPAVAAAVAAPAMATPAPASPAIPNVLPSAPSGAAAPQKGPIPPGTEPKLVVRRGQRINAEYRIYPEQNYIGRADEKPVDIDLEDQEPPDRVWCSRQHAIIEFDDATGHMTIEDLNSSNGTYVNRNKIYPGNKQPLQLGDVIQIGNIHLIIKI